MLFKCSFVIDGNSIITLGDGNKVKVSYLHGKKLPIKVDDHQAPADVSRLDDIPRGLRYFEISDKRYYVFNNRSLDVFIVEGADKKTLDALESDSSEGIEDLYVLSFKGVGACIEVDNVNIGIRYKDGFKLKRVRSCYKCSSVYTGDECYCSVCLGGIIKGGKYDGMSYLWVISNDKEYALYLREKSEVEEERSWFRKNLSVPSRLICPDGEKISPRPLDLCKFSVRKYKSSPRLREDT